MRYLRSVGLTYDEIGKVYSISRQRVEVIIKKKYRKPAPPKVYVKKNNYLSFEEAREFARGLGISGIKKWRAYWMENKPKKLPKCPENVYKNKGWNGWTDFLNSSGQGSRPRNFLSYEEAKILAREHNIKSWKEWYDYSRTNRPNNMPSNPSQHYRDKGWIDWYDFLGKERI